MEAVDKIKNAKNKAASSTSRTPSGSAAQVDPGDTGQAGLVLSNQIAQNALAVVNGAVELRDAITDQASDAIAAVVMDTPAQVLGKSCSKIADTAAGMGYSIPQLDALQADLSEALGTIAHAKDWKSKTPAQLAGSPDLFLTVQDRAKKLIGGA